MSKEARAQVVKELRRYDSYDAPKRLQRAIEQIQQDGERLAELAARVATLTAQLEQQKTDIDAAWQYIQNGYDIEPREWFERQRFGPGQPFASPLQQAMHHIWKRNPRVQELEARLRAGGEA